MKLKNNPATAVIIIVKASIFLGFMTQFEASTRSQNVMAIKKMTLIIVPMISALCHPYVNSLEAGFIVIFKATIDIANPIKSEARWAVSV